MKKHQFVKAKCDCKHRATNFVCKHCGAREYCSYDEIRNLDTYRALCTGADAPSASPSEAFKAKMGGGFDCLAPDFDSWETDGAPPKQ
jgi:hypothetical protein